MGYTTPLNFISCFTLHTYSYILLKILQKIYKMLFLENFVIETSGYLFLVKEY